MRIGNFDVNEKPFVVAEVGNNHEGSYALAEELIGLAKEAGASAVKFQTFLTEHYVSHKDAARFERLKKFQLSFKQFEQLKKTADQAGIILFSTPFDLESARFLSGLLPVMKVSSGDNTFYPLLQEMARAQKPLILSSGMASFAEMALAKQLIEREWNAVGFSTENLAVLHCISLYPAKPEQVDLENIRSLKRELGCTVGYSDHTLGIEVASLSVLFGARIIEKHFTKDKNFSDFRDHQLSADPSDLKALVERVSYLHALAGKGEKRISAEEQDMAKAVRRSVVSARDIEAGTALSLSDITWVRPSGGIPPGQEARILGKKAKVRIERGTVLSAEQFS